MLLNRKTLISSVVFLIIILVGIILFYYNDSLNADNNALMYNQKYSKYIHKLTGETLFDLNKYKNYKSSASKIILVLYYKYDCSSCIMECFNMLNNLSEINIEKVVFTDSDYNNDMKIYGLNIKRYIKFYIDEHKSIKRKLKNVSTPAIIFISNNRIKNIIFPSIILPKKQKNDFWRSIKNNN